MNILCVCTSHRGPQTDTRQCIDNLACAGIPTIMNVGCADIALGRNMDITRGLQRANVDGTEVIVLFDDDMVFSVEQVEKIAAHALEAPCPVSGIYVMKNRELAIWRIEESDRFVAGLGFIAASVKVLNEKAKELPTFRWKDTEATLWTKAGPDEGIWGQEDIYFCKQFGGVEIAPIIVGHLKTIPMAPSRDAVERILGELDTEEVIR